MPGTALTETETVGEVADTEAVAADTVVVVVAAAATEEVVVEEGPSATSVTGICGSIV